MAYSIGPLTIETPDTRLTLDLAVPTSTHPSAINILCGLNGSGKSLLIEQIWRVMTGVNNIGLVSFSPRPQGPPNALFIGKGWFAKDLVGVTNLFHSTNRGASTPAKEGYHRKIARWFLAHQIVSHLPSVSPNELLSEPSQAAIDAIIARVGDGSRIYACRRSDPLVSRLEKTLGGTLYFRCGQNAPENRKLEFHLVLASERGLTVPFDHWSDGQRAFFYITTAIACLHPDVVLFDEPENHLHPGLLSDVLDGLKLSPGQYILATHHPHLIFSRFVDRVFYIDTMRPAPLDSPPVEMEYSTRFLEPRFRRTVVRLQDGFERINNAYRLFHHHDDQLLRQAAYLKDRASLIVLQAIERLFHPDVAKEKASALPDTQTQQLCDALKRVMRVGEESVEVVDLGAGLGRLVAEMDKLSAWQTSSRVRWTCYEPHLETCKALRDKFKGRRDVSVVEDASMMKSDSFRVGVIANVLHELTPVQIGLLLSEAGRVIERDGLLIVLELYPLLRAEGFAVPYDSTTLADVFRKSGFMCDVAVVQLVQSGSTAYCLMARRAEVTRTISAETVQVCVENAWTEILARALSGYSLGRTTNLEQHLSLLSRLTTIATISAWRGGQWHG